MRSFLQVMVSAQHRSAGLRPVALGEIVTRVLPGRRPALLDAG